MTRANVRVTPTNRARSAGVVAAALLVLFALTVPAAGRTPTTKERWVSLFNGKNLDGWVVKIAGHDAGDNVGNTFRVENGVMKVSYDHYKTFDNQFGHLFSKRKYGNYRLRVEYRFVGEQC